MFGAHAVGIRVHRPRYTTAGSKAVNVKARVAARRFRHVCGRDGRAGYIVCPRNSSR